MEPCRLQLCRALSSRRPILTLITWSPEWPSASQIRAQGYLRMMSIFTEFSWLLNRVTARLPLAQTGLSATHRIQTGLLVTRSDIAETGLRGATLALP